MEKYIILWRGMYAYARKSTASSEASYETERYRTAEERAEQLQHQKVTKRFQPDVMECFIIELLTIDASLPVRFSDRLWHNMIDRVTVYEDGSLVFRFKNGAEITKTL